MSLIICLGNPVGVAVMFSIVALGGGGIVMCHGALRFARLARLGTCRHCLYVLRVCLKCCCLNSQGGALYDLRTTAQTTLFDIIIVITYTNSPHNASSPTNE